MVQLVLTESTDAVSSSRTFWYCDFLSPRDSEMNGEWGLPTIAIYDVGKRLHMTRGSQIGGRKAGQLMLTEWLQLTRLPGLSALDYTGATFFFILEPPSQTLPQPFHPQHCMPCIHCIHTFCQISTHNITLRFQRSSNQIHL